MSYNKVCNSWQDADFNDKFLNNIRLKSKSSSLVVKLNTRIGNSKVNIQEKEREIRRGY